MKVVRAFVVLFSLKFVLWADVVPAGVPRQPAIERARELSNVRYHLSYDLTLHADSARAHEEVIFDLGGHSGDKSLDLREGRGT